MFIWCCSAFYFHALLVAFVIRALFLISNSPQIPGHYGTTLRAWSSPYIGHKSRSWSLRQTHWYSNILSQRIRKEGPVEMLNSPITMGVKVLNFKELFHFRIWLFDAWTQYLWKLWIRKEKTIHTFIPCLIWKAVDFLFTKPHVALSRHLSTILNS